MDLEGDHATLRAENARLRQENSALRAQVAHLQAQSQSQGRPPVIVGRPTTKRPLDHDQHQDDSQSQQIRRDVSEILRTNPDPLMQLLDKTPKPIARYVTCCYIPDVILC
jgi:hypothetical protein